MTKKNKYGLATLAVILTLAGTFASASKETVPTDTTVIGTNNLLLLTDEVNGETVGDVISKAKLLDAEMNRRHSKAPLYLFLNTPGGSIQAGLELIEALRGLGRPVNTITTFAASMGFQIVENLDKRLILDKGTLMSHHATGQFQGAFGGVSPNQLQQREHLWYQIVKELDEQTVKRSSGKQTYDSYVKMYDKEVWLTGHESVEAGFADAITKLKCDQSLAGVTVHHVDFLGLDVSFELDNCPINSSPMHLRVSAPPQTALSYTQEFYKTVKAQFLSNYASKHNSAVPLYW